MKIIFCYLSCLVALQPKTVASGIEFMLGIDHNKIDVILNYNFKKGSLSSLCFNMHSN